MNSHEVWQVRVDQRVYKASFEEMVEWIKEGAVLPEDKVSRGNLRWLDAGKVPELRQYFFINSAGSPDAEQGSNQEAEGIHTNLQTGNIETFHNYPKPPVQSSVSGLDPKEIAETDKLATSGEGGTDERCCSAHPDRHAVYICEICENLLCKTCPNSFGSSVKICTLCGGLCAEYVGQQLNSNRACGALNKPYSRLETKSQTVEVNSSAAGKLNITDILDALKYPFRFPKSLIFGGTLFMLFALGQSLSVLGGSLVFAIGFAFALLAHTLAFCVMSKTSENFLQAKYTANFLPAFNKFTLWEDFVHPSLLGLGALFVSFGLFMAVTLGAGIFAWSSFSAELAVVESEMRRTHDQVDSKLRSVQSENSEINTDGQEEIKRQELEGTVEQSRQTQIYSVFGENYLGDSRELERITKSFMRLSVNFLMPICFSFILAFIYFPAACSIAGSTRSFKKTINPVVGFKQIRKLGFDYTKVLLAGFVFLTATLAVMMSVSFAFYKFDLPVSGILPAAAVGAILIFYFWVVFSGILSMAVYKKSETMKDFKNL